MSFSLKFYPLFSSTIQISAIIALIDIKVAAIVKECMENAVQLLVPLQVKLSTGSDWGNLQPYDL